MRRRRFASLVLSSSLIAGCRAPFSSEETILGKPVPPPHGDLETVTRPPADEPPNATSDTVSPHQYPTKPTSYDDESVEEFVGSHERAYRRNELLDRWGADLVSHSFHLNWTVTLETTDEAGVGRCQYRYSDVVDEGDHEVIGDSPNLVVTYYVDGSLIVRAEDTGSVEDRHELAPDPWVTGVVLAPQIEG